MRCLLATVCMVTCTLLRGSRLAATSPPFFSNHTPTTEIYTLSLHDALPIYRDHRVVGHRGRVGVARGLGGIERAGRGRSEEHTSELQSPDHLVCRVLLEKKIRRADAHPVRLGLVVHAGAGLACYFLLGACAG